VTVVKRDWQGREVLRWTGRAIHIDADEIVVDARFARPTLRLPYLTLAQGDRMLEHYYTRHWYNVFEIYAGESSQLKGWYCNIARPVRMHGSLIESEDLALDLFVSPEGKTLLLDEEEFAGLVLSHEDRAQAAAGLADLQALARERRPPFEALAQRGRSLDRG
jgi:hypothetical protein